MERKNNMKRIFKISTLATLSLALTLSGCIKEIDPQQGYATSGQAGNAPGAFDNFVTAITNQLTSSYSFGPADYPWDYGYPTFFLMRDVMGQDMPLEDDGHNWYLNWYSCGTGLGPQYLYCQVPWTYYYSYIKSCNDVINLAGPEPSEAHRSGAGIAYAMRAFFYMDLARMFAIKSYAIDPQAETVPLVLETTDLTALANNSRATNEQMWAQILADLDKAEAYLEGYTRPDKYTPDLSVVYGLKARAYLTMENWAQAEEYARLAQQGYSALTAEQYLDRTNGFNSSTANNSWMFAVTYKSTDLVLQINDADSSWGSQMIPEVAASGMGYAANYGAPKRIDYHLYQTIPATDCRKMCYVDFAIDEMDEASALEALSEYSDVPEDLITAATATTSKAIGGISVKFRPANGNHTNQYEAWCVAVPLMRVEEMQLIEAEAAGMQDEGRGIQLLTAFAQTRDPQYTYGTHFETYGSTYANSFRNEVWWQRRVEFWGEGLATFDIKRLDKGVIRSYAGTNHPEGYRWNVGGYNTTDGSTYPDWMNLCIVQTETNNNSACTQNPTPIMPTQDSPEYNW